MVKMCRDMGKNVLILSFDWLLDLFDDDIFIKTCKLHVWTLEIHELLVHWISSDCLYQNVYTLAHMLNSFDNVSGVQFFWTQYRYAKKWKVIESTVILVTDVMLCASWSTVIVWMVMSGFWNWWYRAGFEM